MNSSSDHQHRPRKRFGQHFLQDQQVIEHLISLLAIKKGEHWVEIGAGLGALTEPLVERCDTLDVIEIDRDVIPQLQLICRHLPQCRIHCADALRFDFSQLVTAGEKLRLVGNLPYNISSPLLFHVLHYAKHVQDMHFMLQKELVDRIVAETGSDSYGRLSVMMQYYCQVMPLFVIKPDAFWPPPKVDSAYIRLVPHQTLPVSAIDEVIFAEVVRLAFNQRRKTIRNSLKSLIEGSELECLGINPNLRAEKLTVKDFAKLSNFLYNKKAI